MPVIGIDITSPENSFIQFETLQGSELITEVCGQHFVTCLPFHFGTDHKFQVYIQGEVDEVVLNRYSFRLVSQDDEEETTPLTVNWLYDEVAQRTWGFIEPSFTASGFADHACANFKIFLDVYNYGYTDIVEDWGNSMTVDLEIDGVMTFIGGGTPADITDIVTLLQAFIGISSAIVQQTTATGINIQSLDGHVYGDLVITEAGPNTYPATPTLATSTAKFISNCLQYTESLCWTRVVEYRGHENIFGFNYELDTAFYNSVRLPIYLDNPQPIIDENYFLLSDGSKKVLSARYEKEYEGHTEYFNEADHFRFLAAMKHDIFLLDDEEYTAEGKYDIGWLSRPGNNLGNAPATFKLRPTPFFQQNSNCVSA